MFTKIVIGNTVAQHLSLTFSPLRLLLLTYSNNFSPIGVMWEFFSSSLLSHSEVVEVTVLVLGVNSYWFAGLSSY
jgi:hypothetical protein